VALGPFIEFVFGAKFLGTVPLLRLMLPGVFFLGLTSVLSQYSRPPAFHSARRRLDCGIGAVRRTGLAPDRAQRINRRSDRTVSDAFHHLPRGARPERRARLAPAHGAFPSC
jgi:hypothetical protein